jgi:hypothetical protein
LNSSLFIVGEFGGNDYNAPIFAGSAGLAEIKTWVPQIVDRIASGVEVTGCQKNACLSSEKKSDVVW